MPRFFYLKLFGFVFALAFFSSPVVIAQTARQDFNRARTFDARHYLIRTGFDRPNKTIFGETTVSLKPLKSGLKTVELDAADLKFEAVVREPDERPLKFKTAGDRIFIELDKNYSPKDLISIRLKYSARPKRGVYFIDPARDGGRLLHDAQIWTQGQTEESRHWFPSYDFPDDKATTEQLLTVAADETVVANGELIETRQNADNTKTLHFRTNLPHSVYLTSFVVGKYVKFTDSHKNIPLGVYLYPGRENLYRQVFANTREMMRIFEELTGHDFPFNKYDQTIVAEFKMGGMENITATTLSDQDVFFSDKNRLIVEDLVAHELAHSWFGNLVTCRNWAELWLNESFATFLEAAYREKMYGRDDYLRKIRSDRDVYFAEEAAVSRKHGLFNRFARPDDSIFDAVAYQKGSAVIHTLRETVGDEAFWKAVNLYLARNKFGNVETADLKKVFEEVSQKNLDWFFSQWIYGAGYPKLEVAYEYDPAAKNLELRVRQTQKDEATPPVFYLPVEIEIATAAGAAKETILITKREEVFRIKLNNPPTAVVFDKDLKIPLMVVKMQGRHES